MTAPRTDARRRDGGRVERGFARGWTCMAGLVALGVLLAPAIPAAAEPGSRWTSLSALAGSAQPVGAMADYQWDVRPHSAWGAQWLAGTGPFAGGLRWWRGGTTQRMGLAGVTDPAVRTGSVELVARARLAQWRNVQWLATASGGRLAISYRPDRITVQTGGTPVEVALTPIHEWVGGAGVALQVPFAAGWSWGLETERRMFALDTAHRSGSSVTYSRETFGDWDARVALSRAWNW